MKREARRSGWRASLVSTGAVGLALLLAGCAAETPTGTAGGAGQPGAKPASGKLPPGVVPVNEAEEVEPSNQKINELLLSRAAQPKEGAEVPLGGGDLLDIRVSDVPELSNLKVRVTPAGTILLPLVGQIHVEGMTVEELHGLIREKLAEKYVKNPQVSISVAESKSHKVAVMGEVNSPGVFDVGKGMLLTDALGMAGGLKEKAATTIYLIRAASPGESLPAQGGAPSPAAPPSRSAGGGKSLYEINMRAILSGKDRKWNVPVHAGDVIEVPSGGSVFVGGRVRMPQAVPIVGGRLTAHQAIVAAGGHTDTGNLHLITIYRRLPNGQKQTIQLDLSRKKRDTGDVFLKKDDVVIVGTATGALAWQVFQQTPLGRFGTGMFFPAP